MDKILYSPGEAVSRVFTTRNPATGAATAATGTPTAVLYKNKVATAVTVTVALITSNLYSLDFTLPSGGSAYTVGDDIFIYLSATIAGVADSAILFEGKIGYQVTRDTSGRVQVQSGTSTGQISLAAGAVTAGTVSDKTGYSLSVTPPTAAATATAVRAELTTELARIDQTVGSRLATIAYTAPANTDILAAIDAIPETDLSGLTTLVGQVKANTDKLGGLTATEFLRAISGLANRRTYNPDTGVGIIYAADDSTPLITYTIVKASNGTITSITPEEA